LNFSTRHPCKNNNIRAYLGFAGWGRLMQVGFFSSILVSFAGQTNKHKLHNPTSNIKPINNGKKKTKNKKTKE
jgi:hypothetical protein